MLADPNQGATGRHDSWSGLDYLMAMAQQWGGVSTGSSAPAPATGPAAPPITPGTGPTSPTPPVVGLPPGGLPSGWVPPIMPSPGAPPADYDFSGGGFPGYGGPNLGWTPPPPPPPAPSGGGAPPGGNTEMFVPFGGYLADGGPAYPGAAYMVGENGPELFSPSSPGTVIPYNGGSMASSSFGMTGIPGANPGGNQVAVPSSGGSTSPAIGGASNPLLPTYPAGQSVVSFPANTGGMAPTTLGAGAGSGGSGGWPGFQMGPEHDFQKAMLAGGYGFGISGPLYQFLKSGAGFNPQVAQALINSMQPYVQRGEADILEQFSNMGLRFGSPAAIGMGDFLSQVNLNEQQVFAQMYEQAIQNYLSVLLSGKKGQPTAPLAGLGQAIGGAGSLFNSIYSGKTGGVNPTPPFSGGNSFF